MQHLHPVTLREGVHGGDALVDPHQIVRQGQRLLQTVGLEVEQHQIAKGTLQHQGHFASPAGALQPVEGQ